MPKYYLLTYQQRRRGTTDWQIANDATDQDPGVWLASLIEKCDETHASVLLSAVEITEAGFTALQKLV